MNRGRAFKAWHTSLSSGRLVIGLSISLAIGTATVALGQPANWACPAPAPSQQCPCELFQPADGIWTRPPNLKPVSVLSALDIDEDGQPDGSIDSDADGLPDNWEVGPGQGDNGIFTPPHDRKVGFYAPTAIGPGTPSIFLTARQIVYTEADDPDTDGDGLTDFVEVFGLKFIDDNFNGLLDFVWEDTVIANGQWDPGERIDSTSEWLDLNNDGLPSVGEFPLPNTDALLQYTWITVEVVNGSITIQPDTSVLRSGFQALNRTHDFDGFMFTDPTNSDTDGDGCCDGADPDPLINPDTFGVTVGNFTRSGVSSQDYDLDNDGLGNGSDFGNDDAQQVDFPTDIADLLSIFRKDRVLKGTVPESLIEDLVGADWDGNGLFRITDVREFKRLGLGAGCSVQATDSSYFTVGEKKLYGEFRSGDSCAGAASIGARLGLATAKDATNYSTLRQGMGYQTLLKPSGAIDQTMPDPRIWAVLYAWRVPGFDIDGDGFVGSPERTFEVDDRHPYYVDNSPKLNGRIDANPCGTISWPFAFSMVACLGVAAFIAPYRRWGRRH